MDLGSATRESLIEEIQRLRQENTRLRNRIQSLETSQNSLQVQGQGQGHRQGQRTTTSDDDEDEDDSYAVSSSENENEMEKQGTITNTLSTNPTKKNKKETRRLRNKVMDLTEALASERRANMQNERLHLEQRHTLKMKLDQVLHKDKGIKDRTKDKNKDKDKEKKSKNKNKTKNKNKDNTNKSKNKSKSNDKHRDNSLSDLEPETSDVNKKPQKNTNQKRRGPKIRAVGVDEDGFEVYDYTEFASDNESDDGDDEDDSSSPRSPSRKQRKNKRKKNKKNNKGTESYSSSEEEEEEDNEELRELRHNLLQEQMRAEDLDHIRKKSQFIAFETQQELEKLKSMSINELKDYLGLDAQTGINEDDDDEDDEDNEEEDSNNNNNEHNEDNNKHRLTVGSDTTSGHKRKDGGRESVYRNCAPDCACREFKRRIMELESKLGAAHFNQEKLDRERRNSLARLSERMFQDMLTREQEYTTNHDSLEIQVQRMRRDKVLFVQSTSSEINNLRDMIRQLSLALNICQNGQCCK